MSVSKLVTSCGILIEIVRRPVFVCIFATCVLQYSCLSGEMGVHQQAQSAALSCSHGLDSSLAGTADLSAWELTSFLLYCRCS